MMIARMVTCTLRIARHAPGGILLVAGIFFTWFWAVEVWLRQEWMFRVNENHLLAAGITGLLAGFTLVGVSRGVRRKRIILRSLVGCGLAFAAIFGFAHSSSVGALWEQTKDGKSNFYESGPWYLGLQERWDEFVVRKFYGKSVHPTWRRYNYRDEEFNQLVETSRWRVKKAFILRIAKDEDKALLAISNWHWLLPAIIGQDVTLVRRQELLHEFSQLSRREDLPGPCRDAMLLWMGLIFLTDHEAFAEHRVGIRDSMLAREAPAFAMTGDVWMRVLNALLAFDLPGTRAGLVSRYAYNPEMLRRAVRESLRGIEQQAEAVMAEITRLDQLDRPSEATALWLDLLHLQNQPMPQVVSTSLQQIITHWLLEASPRVRARFSLPKEASQIHQVSGEDFKIALPEEAQALLVEHAEALIRQLATGANWIPTEEQTLPVEVEHLLMIGQFLDDGRRKSIANALAPHLDEQLLRLLNHDLPEKLRTNGIDETAVVFLRIWNDMDESVRARTREIIRQICGMDPDLREFKEHMSGSLRTEFFFRAWDTCPTQPLGDLERFLAQALSRYRGGWLDRRWWGRFGTNNGFRPCSSDKLERLMSFLVQAWNFELPMRLQIGQGTEGFIHWRHIVGRLARWEFTLREMDAVHDIKKHIQFHLVRKRVLGTEFLPEGWQEIVASTTEAWQVDWPYLDEAFWGPQLATPALAKSMLGRFNDRNDSPLTPVVEFLARHPPEPEIRRTIWEHFDRWFTSGERWQKVTAARAMIKLMGWLEPEGRAVFRQRLDRFFVEIRPSLSEWSHTMMLTMNPEHNFPREYAISEDQCRSEWIPWEEDALSARLSWSSQIHHELHMLPHDWKIYPDDGLFRYLHSHIDACWASPWLGLAFDPAAPGEPVPARARRGVPPELPFARTPWQRARELHLKRPDLEFPDRVMFRPSHHW